jgi:starch phosphorylase
MPHIRVAYFSMEIGLDSAMPTYAGGLGVLAGDLLCAAADLGVPVAGVTLLHRQGYFRQRLDPQGNQTELPVAWRPEDRLERLEPRAVVVIEGRPVRIRAWRRKLTSGSGPSVPVYFLDADLPENDARDQSLTGQLYGGDDRYRLCQEAVLGLGGAEMLRVLGHVNVWTYHMNEGHSALLALGLLEERMGAKGLGAAGEADLAAVRDRCVFTTHTPVPAGSDRFPMALVTRVLGPDRTAALEALGCCTRESPASLNMTFLALYCSRYINGVSMRHDEVSKDMFPQYPINAITNGVHAATWTAPSFQALFDRHVPQWRHDNLYLRYAIDLPLEEVQAAHRDAKAALVAEVTRRTGRGFDPARLTLGFARRATGYKRADLLFADLERLRHIVRTAGPLQVIYAGKAHPRDEGGKEVIRRVFKAAAVLGGELPVIYLEEYDMDLARLLCAGSDVWLNTPLKPREASGTSGMKAALNGVPSLSVLDGWWIEGHVEGVTGWSIGESWEPESDPAREITAFYDKLERAVIPAFYSPPESFDQIRRTCIALNGSFFNAQRMLRQYVANAYGMSDPGVAAEVVDEPSEPSR